MEEREKLIGVKGSSDRQLFTAYGYDKFNRFLGGFGRPTRRATRCNENKKKE